MDGGRRDDWYNSWLEALMAPNLVDFRVDHRPLLLLRPT